MKISHDSWWTIFIIMIDIFEIEDYNLLNRMMFYQN